MLLVRVFSVKIRCSLFVVRLKLYCTPQHSQQPPHTRNCRKKALHTCCIVPALWQQREGEIKNHRGLSILSLSEH